MAKTFLAGIILGGLVALSPTFSPVWAAAPSDSPALIATPPQPAWSDLTIPQKIVLAPLSDDWDSLEYFRQKKWLTIAARFTAMSPEEQRRVQRQMQEWGKLTPLQRQIARENFKATSQLPNNKRQELKQKWEAYSSLPEEEKARFKAKATNTPTERTRRAQPPLALPQQEQTKPSSALPAPAEPVPAKAPSSD